MYTTSCCVENCKARTLSDEKVRMVRMLDEAFFIARPICEQSSMFCLQHIPAQRTRVRSSQGERNIKFLKGDALL